MFGVCLLWEGGKGPGINVWGQISPLGMTLVSPRHLFLRLQFAQL